MDLSAVRHWAAFMAMACSLVLSIVSCEKVVTDELNVADTPPRLVIEGGIERNPLRLDRPQRIRLTTTIAYLSRQQPPAVENAVVKVDDGSQEWIFSHVGDGWYEATGIEAEVGKTYTLSIVWNGDMYLGGSTMQAVPPIDSLYYAYEAATTITEEGYFVRIDVTDPAGVENFYYYRVLVNDTVFIVPDRGNNRTLVLSDAFFDGQTSKGVNPNEEIRISIGDTVTVQQLAITRGYYDYLYSLFTQTGNQGLSVVGNPPPAPIRSNLLNTTSPAQYPLGHFYAADVFEKTVVIE